MASTDQFLFSDGRFEFHGKIYKLKYAIPKPSITMIAEDGTIISFAEDSRISHEFKLLSPNACDQRGV